MTMPRPDSAQPAAQSLLDIHDLRFNWPRQPLLLDIQKFSMAPGEHVLLQGHSGSGKSTFLGLLAGIHNATAGSICLLGHPLESLGAAARDRLRADHVGYIFQQFNLLPFVSVWENVLLPCHFSKTRRLRAEASQGSITNAARHILKALQIPENLLHVSAIQLSIGQQQRVAAARALIGAPELIIADEPTSALDPDSQSAFLKLLFGQSQAQGSALLMVSHDPSMTRHFTQIMPWNALNRAATTGFRP